MSAVRELAPEPADATCPCCGGAVARPDLLLDEGNGIVAFDGRHARLTRVEFRFLRVLLDSYPAVVPKDRIMHGLYDTDDHPEPKIIDVLACKIRKKVEGLGIEIGTSWGIGFRIELRGALLADAERRRSKALDHRRRVLDASDLPLLRLLRSQNLPLTGIAQRMGLTYRAVCAGIDLLEEQEWESTLKRDGVAARRAR